MVQPPQIESVPPEMWAEIFLHARKPFVIEATSNQVRSQKREVPSTVSRVCNRFRQIATSIPQLWSTIIVDFAYRKSSSMLSLTKLWLERSKKSPLSIVVWNVSIPRMTEEPEQRECFIALMSHISRWKHVAIQWGSGEDELSGNFWPSMEIAPDAPLLESLILRPHMREDITEDGRLPSMMWADSPGLQKLVVVLNNIYKDKWFIYTRPQDAPWPTRFNVPYDRLTHLSLSGTNHEIILRKELYSIFETATNLVCCFVQCIAGPEPESTNGNSPPPVLLLHLRHVFLDPSDEHYVDVSTLALLEYITAPSLCH